MIVVTSEGLGRINDREGRSASGDCEGDSNKYEDFFHGRILKKSTWNYTTRSPSIVTGITQQIQLSLSNEAAQCPLLIQRILARTDCQLLSRSVNGDHHGSPHLPYRLRKMSLSVHILN